MATHPANGQLYSPGITRIAVSGFKSLANKVDVEIRHLTVLAGANSSGKSALMQPLLLMKQTLESDVIPAGPFRLSGPYTNFTESKQFLSRLGPDSSSEQILEIDFEIGEQMAAGMTFAADPGGVFDVVETRGSHGQGFVRPGVQKIRLDSSTEEITPIDFPWMGEAKTKDVVDYHVERYKYYLIIQASVLPDGGTPKPYVSELYAVSALNLAIRELIHIPGRRGEQQRKRLLANVPRTSPFATNTFEGPFEEYVPSLIDQWQDSKNQQKMSQLSAGLAFLDLAFSVRAIRLNESEIEVRVPRAKSSGEGDLVNICDVGLAVSSVLPVLVAMIQADPGQLVYIEQPELHLHPRAQWNLARLLADAANRGARLVIETHSSLLLRGILTQIAQDKISNDNVILHWFERDKETGFSTVHSKEPDPAGRVGDWPEDFGDVELGSDNDYLDAVEGKLFAGKK